MGSRKHSSEERWRLWTECCPCLQEQRVDASLLHQVYLGQGTPEEKGRKSFLNSSKHVSARLELEEEENDRADGHNASREDDYPGIVSFVSNRVKNGARDGRAAHRTNSHTGIDDTRDHGQPLKTTNSGSNRDCGGEIRSTAKSIRDRKDKHDGNRLGKCPDQKYGQTGGKSRNEQSVDGTDTIADKAHNNSSDSRRTIHKTHHQRSRRCINTMLDSVGLTMKEGTC